MFFSNIDMPKLLADNAEKLESPITEGEIRLINEIWEITRLWRFPWRILLKYVDILATVLQVFQEAFDKGWVPPPFKEALISGI